MSITFWAPDAPTVREVPYPDQDPDFVVERSVLPEVNLANANALALLKAVGVTPDYSGVWDIHDLAEVRDQIEAMIQDDALAERGERPAYLRSRPLSSGPSFVDPGANLDYLRGVGTRLLALVNTALRDGYRVVWG